MSARNRVSYSMAIGLAAGVIVLITGMRLVTSRTSVNGVTISPRGSVLERDANSGTVLFYITNAEPSLVHLGHLELQVTSSNGWKTITEEWSPMLNPSGASSGQWAGTLAGPPDLSQGGARRLCPFGSYAFRACETQPVSMGRRKRVPHDGPTSGGEPSVFPVVQKQVIRAESARNVEHSNVMKSLTATSDRQRPSAVKCAAIIFLANSPVTVIMFLVR